MFLAAGGTGGGVRLFSFNASTGTFDLAANLTGAISQCCFQSRLVLFLSFTPPSPFSLRSLQVIPIGSNASVFRPRSPTRRSSSPQAARTAQSVSRAFSLCLPPPLPLPHQLVPLVRSFRHCPHGLYPPPPLCHSCANSTLSCALTLIGSTPCDGWPPVPIFPFSLPAPTRALRCGGKGLTACGATPKPAASAVESCHSAEAHARAAATV